MNAISVLALTGYVALQASVGTLRLSDATRVAWRRSSIEDGSSFDVEQAPFLSLELAWPTQRLQLAYSPQLAWLDALDEQESSSAVLHGAMLAFTLRRPRYQLSLSQTGSFGDRSYGGPVRRDSIALDAIDPAEIDPLGADGARTAGEPGLSPAARAVSVAEAQSRASFRYELSPRWSSELAAGWGFSGGSGSVAQRRLPRIQIGELEVGLSHRRSRRDALATRARAVQIDTSNGYKHVIGSLVERWTIDWSADSSSQLGLGAALHDTSEPTGRRATGATALASVSTAHAIRSRAIDTELALGVDYGPAPNELLGALQPRLSAVAALALRTNGASVVATLGAAQTVPPDGPTATRALTAGIELDRELAPWIGVQLGADVSRQEVSNHALPEPTLTVWRMYAGLSAHPLEKSFRCC